MVMAGEAQHEKIRIGVVAAADDAEPVVDVELALRARDTTDFAAATAVRDQLAPPR